MHLGDSAIIICVHLISRLLSDIQHSTLNTHTHTHLITLSYSWCARPSMSLLSTYSNRHTPSPPTKSFDFRGFDSSKLLILKGGNSHVRIIL